MSEAPSQIAVGETVADRYRIDRVLGEGGMGVVYLAEHMLMRKEVALKVLHGEMCTMPEIVARFEREAIAAAAIDHPNVAGATDFGRLPDGACYLVLELLKGESLRDEIKKGPMPLQRALVIMRGIANGVAAAHAKNIVHRDLKPENVMLVERDGLADFVKVLDFGIAKMDTHAQETGSAGQIVTRVGTIFGTPEYMAPEQAVGDKVDARADIFSLGIILLEMLTGACPYKGEVLNVLRERILMTQMPDMSAIDSVETRALITKMMQRHPDDRLQTATELLAAIDAIEGESTNVPPGRLSQTGPSYATASNRASAFDVTANTSAQLRLVDEPSVGPLTAEIIAPQPRPKWLVPAAVASVVGLLLVVIAFAAAGGEDRAKEPKETKEAVASSSASAVVVASAATTAPPAKDTKKKLPGKRAPAALASSAPSEPEPDELPAAVETPAPSASASASAFADSEAPEPATSASAAPSGSVKPMAPAAQRPQQRKRKTGPGGIYIPPPKDWFK